MTVTRPDLELVVWDFDGTIADTRRVIVNSFTQVFAERDLGDCDATQLSALIGLPLVETFARMTGAADPALLDAYVAHYRAVFAERVATEAALFEGVDDLLATCASSGLRCAIATSRGRASLDDLIDRFGIGGHFTAVLCDDDVTDPKPHPELVRRATAAAGVDPTRTLVVGDTVFDVEMGRRAGATTCGVTWGNQTAAQLTAEGPDHLVDTVTQLAGVIGIPAGRA